MARQRRQYKRRCLNSKKASETTPVQTLENTVNDASEAEQESWNGFCEIESEPALFNVMLREFGVKGVKVQEVVSLDDEMLAFLNKPVYGLIYLFRWREDDPGKQEASCPEGLWFANQTACNACASVALINIVNNIEGIDLGENLQHFKDFTMPFTPALRGDAINNFDFIKRIHNSFARKMDRLNSDLQLKDEATTKKTQSKKGKRQDEDETDAAFHFIAFVPAMGKVWKLDGLERQPQAIGECAQDNWLDLAKPNILSRMAEYEGDQIEFSILSLVRDPLLDFIGKLAANVKCLRIANERLHVIGTTSPETTDREATLVGPDPSYGLTQEELDQATPTAEEVEALQSCSADELLQQKQRLSKAQQELRMAIREEQQSHQADDNYAIGLRYDYGPAVERWVRLLARKKKIKTLL